MMLAFLAENGVWIAVVTGLVAVILVLAFLLWRQERRSSAATAAPAPSRATVPAAPVTDAAAVPTGTAFRTVLARLRDQAGVRSVYTLPWILLMGEQGSGKSTLLRSARVPRLVPLDDTPSGEDATVHCFEGGVVIDADGAIVMRADGREGAQDRWRRLTGRLQRHRPERGLDGVIVTISCADLTGPTALNADNLAGKGDRIQERLWDLQRQIGLRLPVYIVVTQCDRVRGFCQFWRQTAQGGADTMLGWASPVLADKPFDPSDIDHAFEEISRQLWAHFVEAAAGIAKPEDPDGMFQFPASFGGLAGPLKILLGRILRVAPYQEGHAFRGVWFTGAAEEAEPQPSPILPGMPVPLAAAVSAADTARAAPGMTAGRTILFVGDLLSEKVFKESQLARPARAGLVARTRAERTAQFAFAAMIMLMVIGQFVAGNSLKELVGQLEPPLALIYNKMATGQNTADAGFDSEAAAELLGQFELIGRDWMRYGAYPTSFFDGTEEDVSKAFGVGLKHLVLTALHRELEERYDGLARNPTVPPVPAERDYAIGPAPDLAALNTYMQKVAETDRMATAYAGVTQGPLEGMADLANSLFETRIDGDFSANSGLYRRGLRSIQAPPLNHEHPKRINPVVLQLAAAFVHRLGPDGAAAKRAERLQSVLADIRRPPPGQDVGRRMQDLANDLVAVRRMLDDPGFSWLAAEDMAALPPIAELQALMATPSVEPALRVGFIERLRGAQAGLRKAMLAMRDASGRPMFVTVPEGPGLRLNDSLHTLAEVFQPALDRPFMQPQKGEPLVAAPAPFSGMALRWDRDGLEQALRQQKSYEEFLATDLPRIPQEFRAAVDRMARQRLEATIRAELVAAQRIMPAGDRLFDDGEAALTGEIRDLRAVGGQLGALLSVIERQRMDGLAGEFRKIIHDHADGLLEQVDSLIAEQPLYETVDAFAGWDGTGSPRPAGFHTADNVAMEQYLGGMRGRITYVWDNMAAPLVELLSREELGTGSHDDITLATWRQIGQEVQRYRANAPGGTLSALEQFLRTDLDAIRLDTCETQLAGADAGRSSDFFLHRRDAVRQMLLERCRDIAGGAVLGSYQQLATLFNDRLAGNYPFVRSRTGEGTRDADPVDVAEFLRIYGEVGEQVRTAFAGRAKGDESYRAAARFLDQMAKVHAFLGPILVPAERPDGSFLEDFDIAVDFRVLRDREVEANQIIDWSLQVGIEILRQGAEAPRAAWRPGEPVALRLRWAKDGKVVPVPADGGPGVDGRTAVFAYDGRWALLRFLQAHRGTDSDFGRTGDRQPHTLRFTVPTAPADADLTTQPTGEARVYVRTLVGVAAPPVAGEPAKVQRLELPTFPAQAPESPSIAGGT